MTIDELINTLLNIKDKKTVKGESMLTGTEEIFIKAGCNVLDSFYVYYSIAPDSLGKTWAIYFDLADNED